MDRINNNSNGFYHNSTEKEKNYILHPVSRFDTLAGIAIKYGVEVADIKKMNGLATDLQMFALKSLQIPLPGRHPPSPCLANPSESSGQNHDNNHTPPRRGQYDILDSRSSLRLTSKPRRKISPAMSSLQGYYGLKPVTTNQKPPRSDGYEMAVYSRGESEFLEPFPSSSRPLGCHRKCRSLANCYMDDDDKFINNNGAGEVREIESDKWNDKLVRRRQKSEADFRSNTPKIVFMDDNSSGGGFSSITGKRVALRPKAAAASSSASAATRNEGCELSPKPLGMVDTLMAEVFSGVRKSSSTSSLQEQDPSALSSIWPATSKWSLKPDLQQALSTVAITKPIFDGLPKPLSNRKNKARHFMVVLSAMKLEP